MGRSYDDWLSDEGDYIRHLQAIRVPDLVEDTRPSGGELEQMIEIETGGFKDGATDRRNGQQGASDADNGQD